MGQFKGWSASSQNLGAFFAKPQSSPGHPTINLRTGKALGSVLKRGLWPVTLINRFKTGRSPHTARQWAVQGITRTFHRSETSPNRPSRRDDQSDGCDLEFWYLADTFGTLPGVSERKPCSSLEGPCFLEKKVMA